VISARLRALGTALAAGVLLCLSVPPWGWWPLAFAGLVLLERLVADQPWKRRFGRTWLVAAALFFPSLIWMQSLTLPGYLIACVMYSCMLGAGVALCPPGPGRWVALPGGLALAELLRWSWPFGGVPLSNLAIGQVAGPLAPILRVGSALGLLVATLLLGMAAAAGCRRSWRAAALLGLLPVVLLAGALVAPRGHEVETIDVALVQGGGPQGTSADDTDPQVVFARHLRASTKVRTPVDLVLWPEDVVDLAVPLEQSPAADPVRALAAVLRAPVVVGVVEDDGTDRFRNAAAVVLADGTFGDRYEKVHRVPFGEYVPLRGLLEKLAGDALPSRDAISGSGPATLDTPAGRMGVSISWEIFFPERARDGIANGGRILLNPTNGSSFTGTIVQSQQVASSRMRAIETGRWVLQAAPTGFTAIVRPDGTVVERSAISEARVLHGTVGLREGQTIATRVGRWPAILLALALIAVGWWIERRERASGLRQAP
jgi:apolipoprotein N-acyltransferase